MLTRFLKIFDVDALKCFLEPLGVLIKRVKTASFFPYSLQASSVADALSFETERLGVELLTNCEVQDIKKTNGGFFGFFANEGIFLPCRHYRLRRYGRRQALGRTAATGCLKASVTA